APGGPSVTAGPECWPLAGPGGAGFFGGLAAAVFVEHRRGGRRAAAGAAEVAHKDQPVEIAHAAGSLDLHFRRASRTHELEVVLRGAFVGVLAIRALDETVAGRRLHPVGAGALSNLAELPLEVVAAKPRAAVGEVVVFENHLHLRPALVGFVAHGANIVFDILPVTAQGLSKVNDHVDFGRPVSA